MHHAHGEVADLDDIPSPHRRGPIRRDAGGQNLVGSYRRADEARLLMTHERRDRVGIEVILVAVAGEQRVGPHLTGVQRRRDVTPRAIGPGHRVREVGVDDRHHPGRCLAHHTCLVQPPQYDGAGADCVPVDLLPKLISGLHNPIPHLRAAVRQMTFCSYFAGWSDATVIGRPTVPEMLALRLPPSTGITVPVTIRAASEARNKAGPTMSSALTRGPSGTPPRKVSPISRPSAPASPIHSRIPAESTCEGAMALTRIPLAPHSRASSRVR